ncbi:DNA-binding protein WhiA [Acetoanaerobium pronyense]|uniref:Probable cell division protein WhiA n=1 Tax=Acetoanaerobium pronyense TaxID=1482736 RepID=A0ABS4KGC6_9FIRM|nr:DNA-binding protein WhiA [Acetoanaerobium pronyense]MBP2026832.1 DNA-binding protein WhiA [Acetoanaerobium pronyense]
MSFSMEVKNELSRIIADEEHVKIAELAALVRMSGSLKLMGFNKLSFKVVTENPAIARKVFSLLKSCFGIHVDIEVRKNKNLKKNNTYSLLVPYEQGANDILEKVGIIEKQGENVYIRSDIPDLIVKDEDSKRAYIRGAFLGGGSVSDPEKTYHVELVTLDEELSVYLMNLLNTYDFNAKIIPRKNTYVIYLKESNHISDFFNIMGAHNALFQLEDIKIKKQMRNDVNRIVNCETANLTKTVNAAMRQVESIKYIMQTVGLEYLPDNLREIAELRIEYDDLSLKELGEMLESPLGKSGVNHRLKKIEEIADKLREGRRD